MAGGLHNYEVRLYRDSFHTPWGFRVQGGSDFHQPLTIQRVFPGSPAEGELHRGDIISAIDAYDATSMLHKDAQEMIRSAGGELHLLIRRAGHGHGHGRVSNQVSPLQYNSAPRAPRVSSHTMPRGQSRDQRPTWRPSGVSNDLGVSYNSPHSAPAPAPGRQHAPVYQGGWGQPLPAHVAIPVPAPAPRVHNHQPDAMMHTVNQHLNNMDLYAANQRAWDDQDVDYSFMDKSVSERKRMFQGPSYTMPNPVHRGNPRPLRVVPNAAYGVRTPEFGWGPHVSPQRGRPRFNSVSRAGYEQDSYLPSQGMSGRDTSPPWSGSLRRTDATPVQRSRPQRSSTSSFSTTLRIGATNSNSACSAPCYQPQATVCLQPTTACAPGPRSLNGPNLMNKQYNSPINLYSKENILSTMSTHPARSTSSANIGSGSPKLSRTNTHHNNAPQSSNFHPAYPANSNCAGTGADNWNNSPIYRQTAAPAASAPKPTYQPVVYKVQKPGAQQQTSPRRSRSSRRAPGGAAGGAPWAKKGNQEEQAGVSEF